MSEPVLTTSKPAARARAETDGQEAQARTRFSERTPHEPSRTTKTCKCQVRSTPRLAPTQARNLINVEEINGLICILNDLEPL